MEDGEVDIDPQCEDTTIVAFLQISRKGQTLRPKGRTA